MVREGLDCLRVSLVEFSKFYEEISAITGNRRRDWNTSQTRSYLTRIESGYLLFLQTLHDTTRRMVLPLDSAMMLDILYATMILSIIRRILYVSGSRGILGLDITEDGSYTKGSACPSYRPMVLALETSYKTFSEHCNDFYGINYPEYVPWRFVAVLLPQFGSGDTFVEKFKQFIDRVELKLGSAGIRPGERAISKDSA